MAATGVIEGPKLFQGVARNDFAFKLLKQMGWEEGMGLGKEKQGIKTHIRVRKNVEQSGVGLAEAKKQAADWTINTSIYDRILANLKVKSAGERANDAGQNDSESEDEEEVVKKSKKQKINGEGKEEGRKSKKRKSEKEEVKDLEAEEKQPRKLARHVGRYKKREASKAVAGYASHHLQEILGGQPSSPKVELPTADMGTTRVTLTQEETAETVVVKKKKKKSRGSKENSPSKDPILSVNNETATEKIETVTHCRITSTTAVSTSLTAVTESTASVGVGGNMASRSPAEDPDWWGHQYGFVRGGGLGEKQKKKESGDEAKRGFLEQDQEDLYNLVQDKKTSGKQGLGIGSQPKKVAGARWKGSKVNFDDDGESEEETDEGPSAANDKVPAVTSYNDVLEAVRGARDEDLVGNGNILSIEDKTRRADAKDREFRSGGGGAGSDDGEQTGVGTIKWKKLLMKELEEVGLKGIKLSKLRKRLAAAAVAKPGFGGLDKAEVKTTAEEKIRTSSKCIINGDRVFPATGVALPLKHKA